MINFVLWLIATFLTAVFAFMRFLVPELIPFFIPMVNAVLAFFFFAKTIYSLVYWVDCRRDCSHSVYILYYTWLFISVETILLWILHEYVNFYHPIIMFIFSVISGIILAVDLFELWISWNKWKD